MIEVEIKKALKKFMIVLSMIVFALLVASFSPIQNTISKMSIQNTKKKSNVSTTLTTKQAFEIAGQQYEIANHYKKKREWLYKEIFRGGDTIYSNYTYLSDHTEYDKAKFKLTITKYKVNGSTLEFISSAKITQVHSKDGWKDKE
ncbi:hypothetical protein [Gottfriedia luciferensis]|uniref:hypothetical protein n=1 Tax=Gottfriedia luciferensis TaxID=178774 RepID=UPI000B43D177|nr:hypothetical protein [Gottfriedia luciferensis]